MRNLVATFLLLGSPLACADVINVEFKFTPYTGDLTRDQVETVPGKARVYLNNVLVAEQDVAKQMVPVIFDEREIAPSVWLPIESMGPSVRKGRNMIRIEFQPADPKSPYRGQLTWASVTDQTIEVQHSPGSFSSTNQTGEGKADKQATGKLVFEREFTADFAEDLPWHHYAPIKALSDGDKQQLAALVVARTGDFKPDFSNMYSSLAKMKGVQVIEIKKAKCLDAAYSAGVRVKAPTVEQLDFAITGNPEILVQGKAGFLYDVGSPATFEKIKGDDAQMCAAMVLSMLYPPHMAVVRTPAGGWEVVY
jgi:hypothetical protein